MPQAFSNSGDLDGKTALVTGGGQGIGRGIALELARAGADLVVTQRNVQAAQGVAAEVRKLGRQAIALAVDVREEASVNACIQAAFEQFSNIDILVNNAGVAQSRFDLKTDLQAFDQCHEVNVRGAWSVTAALIPHFRQRKSGKVINIASIEGRRGTPQQPAYSASKAAMISLTQSLAALLGPDGINVNAVCPGPVWTAQQENYQRLAASRGEIDEALVNEADFYRQYADAIALRRVATPQDVGFAVAFLASQRARNITGQALNVDGGIMMN